VSTEGERDDEGRRKPRKRAVAATAAAALVAIASALTWYIDARADRLDEEQAARDRATFQSVCDDPVAAAALVENQPALGRDCPAGVRHMLAIPASVSAGPDLVDAYVDRLLLLLTSEVPGNDVGPFLGALHRDGRYTEALSDLRHRVRGCQATTPSATPAGLWDDPSRIEVVPDRATVRVTAGPTISAQVVDTLPSCVTRDPGEAPVPVFTGTTALTLAFSTGTGPAGEPVWLLDRLRACPVRPDPLAGQPVRGDDGVRMRRSLRESPSDSLFAFADACPADPPTGQPPR